MKKLLGIVVLGLLWCNVANANILELEKCYNAEQGYSSEGFISNDLSDMISVWNKDRYERSNTYYAKIVEPYEAGVKNKFWRNVNVLYYSHRELPKTAKLQALIGGYEKIETREKWIYSINGADGTITELWERTDKSFKFRQDAHSQLISHLRKKGLYEGDIKKRMQDEWKYIKDKRTITKYQIAEFVGDLIYAHKIEGDNLRYPPDERFGILIDIKKMTVIHNMMMFIDMQSNQSNVQICTTSYASGGSDQSGPSSGTAFFISNKGYMLTNNHVVEGCEVSKINYFNKEYDTELISTDKTLDLALLKVNLKPKSYISFSNKEARKRQEVVVAGYPLGKGLSDDLKINDGRISSLKGFENNSNEVTVDIAINPGNSGGPIVNEKGQLVAIAVSGMSKDVTEGINFGIKASAASNFLKSNKIRPHTAHFNFSMNEDKLVELLEESTVYIFCNKFQSLAKADYKLSNPVDDIKEFQMEGISLGDSALDHFSKDEIDQKKISRDEVTFEIKIYDVENSNLKDVLLKKNLWWFKDIVDDSIKVKNLFKVYNSIKLHINKNDPNYIIHMLTGSIFLDNYQKRCFNRMDKIAPYIKKTSIYKDFEDLGVENKTSLNGLKSKTKEFFFSKPDLPSVIKQPNVIVIKCIDNIPNYFPDQLTIYAVSNEFNKIFQ